MKNAPLDKLMQLHEKEMNHAAQIMHDCDWENPRFYENWCAQFFFFVAHATRILSASAARSHLDKDSQHLYFIDHCQEEKNHEKLFERDLEYFGTKPSDYEEHPLAASLYQSQYYLIDYVNPMALYGSILFLEGLSISAGPQMYARVKKCYGDKACHFIKVHVHEDQDHIVKAKKALANLDKKEIEAVTRSYLQSAYAYNTLLKEITAQVTSRNKKAA